MLQWVPFAVSSPVLFGTGKVGSENGQPPTPFQLSQRADFIDCVVGSETVASKSLVNTRDEPLADPERFARFHVTAVFDFNCCPFATFLKFGTTQILLGLLEAQTPLPDLRLEQPLEALARVSLARRLDWVVKKSALDQWQHELRAPADDPRLVAIDLRYAELDDGWYEDLERRHLIEGLTDFLPRAIPCNPPRSSGRDVARARILEKFSSAIRSVDWHGVCLSVSGSGGPATHEIVLDDPLETAALQRAIEAAESPQELVRCLPDSLCRRVACPVTRPPLYNNPPLEGDDRHAR
jgi:hypothetical protein